MYLIQSFNDHNLYWNEWTGWGSKENATHFDENEIETYPLPTAGMWIAAA